MKPADIIILLIVIVAMVFAARKAAGHLRRLSAAEAAMEVQETEENSWTVLFLEPGRSASKACIASTAWIL